MEHPNSETSSGSVSPGLLAIVSKLGTLDFQEQRSGLQPQDPKHFEPRHPPPVLIYRRTNRCSFLRDRNLAIGNLGHTPDGVEFRENAGILKPCTSKAADTTSPQWCQCECKYTDGQLWVLHLFILIGPQEPLTHHLVI